MEPIARPECAADPEQRFVEFATDQPEYLQLQALVYEDGKVMTEWRLTEAERALIRGGENIRLWVWTFGYPLQPIALEVTQG